MNVLPVSERAPHVMMDDLLPQLHESISQLLDSLERRGVSCPGGTWASQ